VEEEEEEEEGNKGAKGVVVAGGVAFLPDGANPIL
jgi:hypothetical protein